MQNTQRWYGNRRSNVLRMEYNSQNRDSDGNGWIKTIAVSTLDRDLEPFVNDYKINLFKVARLAWMRTG